jgi:hypothetical protein
MLQLDAEKFTAVVSEALTKAQAAPKDAARWTRAINKARAFLDTSAMWHLCDDDTLLLISDSSFEVYEIGDDSCERIDAEQRVNCPAFGRGEPCYHRAMRRLLLAYASE